MAVWIGGILMAQAGVMWVNPSSFVDDPDAYRRIAWTLDQSGVFGVMWPESEAKPTAFRPPLYPILLSTITTEASDATIAALPQWRIGILHLLLNAVTLICVAAISAEHFGRASAGLACLMIGVDPILIRQSTLVMTEPLATALTAWTLWWWMRHRDETTGSRWVRSLIIASTLGLAFLCRPTFLVWAFLLALLAWIELPRRTAMIRFGVIASVMLVTVGAWTYRNFRVMGHPVWATTHGGYTILLGNNRFFYDYLSEPFSWTAWDATPFLNAYEDRHDASVSMADLWQIPPESVATLPKNASEIDEDRWAGDVAKATITSRPAMFVWACGVRLMRLWSPVPLSTGERSTLGLAVISVYYVLFGVLFLVSMLRHKSRLLGAPWLAIWAMVLALSAVHSVYWSNLRMRTPAMPGLAVIAAGSIARSTALARREDDR
ncbi:ArnT family glycosyltransferase [Crateriforma spongiae]|uniref:ArnT family glycosyltransferase n=1 Tax=Crateriforma spongiae TaxID=2724528 RepID=UPI0014459C8D|nr:glycosyltransferase family 39 protein [Crateriforma spongiae]